jgi:hypothetical protein
MAVTPVAWVGLIAAGAVIAASAAGSSIWIDGVVKNNAGDWYDSIMTYLGIK